MGEIKGIMIALMILGGVMVGFTGWYAGFLAAYDTVPANVSIANVSGAIDNQTREIGNQLQDVSFNIADPLSVGLSTLALLQAGIQAFLLLFGLGDLMTTLASESASVLGVPYWAVGIVLGVFLIILIFGMFKALGRGDL